MSAHVASVKHYVLVFLALIGLTALTTGVAYVNLGPLNTVAALAIAVGKMLLVILFFMHVRHSSHLTKIVIVAAFFWFLIFISLTLSDFRTRHWTPDPPPWGSAQAPSTSTVEQSAAPGYDVKH